MAVYGQDLAYAHDTGFGQLAKAGGQVSVDLLRRGGQQPSMVLDIGCGSSIASQVLSQNTHAVCGVDLSEAPTRWLVGRVPAGRSCRRPKR
ncbi:MAG: hypothetical protein KF752_00880 [Pirellulaceae bacterium]|nr:hypothetical protein [Pirellulaceae bacterium]